MQVGVMVSGIFVDAAVEPEVRTAAPKNPAAVMAARIQKPKNLGMEGARQLRFRWKGLPWERTEVFFS
jgi:hypothetical protein